MKTYSPLLALFLVVTATAGAAPLTATTAVHSQPNEASPTVMVLKAGSEPVPALGAVADVPTGWMAITLPGPFDGYVQNRDIMKSLDVRPGAPIYLAPKPGAVVLTTMEKSDKTNITGLHGKWTQISIQKPLTGFVHIAGNTGSMAANTSSPSASTASMSPPPVPTVAYGVTSAGRPAPMLNLGDGGSSTLPRLFQGKFVSTHNPFRPRRPFDWALDDDGGERYAYLDMTKLLLTEQLDKYIDHHVVVYGAAKSVPGRKDIVIEVESLQLK